jgi:anti-sigma regulatory factor (Ser/Thr protein kinase)
MTLAGGSMATFNDWHPSTHLESLRFPNSEASVPRVRDFVATAVGGRLATGRLGDLRLCVSELATNAVAHGTPPDGQFAVAVVWDKRCICVEVRDTGGGSPVVASAAGTDEHGRGLALVQALADDWGVFFHPVGKTVWFALKAEGPG